MIKRVLELPIRAKLRLAKLILADPRVPWYAKAIVPALILYLAMPLDIIPDFIPVIGYLDDLLVVALGGWLFAKLCPEHALAAQLERVEAEI